YLDERIARVTDEIEALARADESRQRLITVPGIGPIISSAMVAAIGNGAAFAKGRDFAAWLGLVPKQISTGDRTILGRITKRGNRYLRMLFMQGARVILLKTGKLGKAQLRIVADGRGTPPPSQRSSNRAGQQAGADRLDCIGARSQLRGRVKPGAA